MAVDLVGVVLSVLAAGAVALILRGVVFPRLRDRTATSTAPWRRGARTGREIVLPVGVDEAERLVRALLEAQGDERATAASAEGRVLEAVTPRNWRTTGTVLRVVLQPVAGGALVSVSGWPGAQLFDWGDSRRRVEQLIEALGSVAGGPGDVSRAHEP